MSMCRYRLLVRVRMHECMFHVPLNIFEYMCWLLELNDFSSLLTPVTSIGERCIRIKKSLQALGSLTITAAWSKEHDEGLRGTHQVRICLHITLRVHNIHFDKWLDREWIMAISRYLQSIVTYPHGDDCELERARVCCVWWLTHPHQYSRANPLIIKLKNMFQRSLNSWNLSSLNV